MKCTKCNEGKLPLSAYSDFNSFKVYMTDTGLLCSKFGIPANAADNVRAKSLQQYINKYEPLTK